MEPETSRFYGTDFVDLCTDIDSRIAYRSDTVNRGIPIEIWNPHYLQCFLKSHRIVCEQLYQMNIAYQHKHLSRLYSILIKAFSEYILYEKEMRLKEMQEWWIDNKKYTGYAYGCTKETLQWRCVQTGMDQSSYLPFPPEPSEEEISKSKHESFKAANQFERNIVIIGEWCLCDYHKNTDEWMRLTPAKPISLSAGIEAVRIEEINRQLEASKKKPTLTAEQKAHEAINKKLRRSIYSAIRKGIVSEGLRMKIEEQEAYEAAKHNPANTDNQ